ncbi:MAG: hypothetical protein Q9187_000324 [Circinaria calcarea]
MLLSPSDCQKFLLTSKPAAIAAQLRQDQERCRLGTVPSILVLYVPPFSSELGEAISKHLNPQADEQSPLPRLVRQLQYNGAVRGIKVYLQQMKRDIEQEEPNTTVNDDLRTPTMQKFEAALEVLQYLRIEGTVSLDDVLAKIKNHIAPDLAARSHRTCICSPLELIMPQNSQATTTIYTSFAPQERNETEPRYSRYEALNETQSQRPGLKQRRCYICSFKYCEPHDHYPSLCKPCGDFNIAESRLSLPGSLDLSGKTALVTGGRVNLGFTTALRLLRCGAKVIVSSRYPRDAETRFHAQSDCSVWGWRLAIIGADFRSARDAFRLVALVKKQLGAWTADCGTPERLDILINNAAQTLTDSVQTERRALQQEDLLRTQEIVSSFLIDNDTGYSAQIRGGMRTGLSNLLCGGGEPESSTTVATPLSDHQETPQNRPDEMRGFKDPWPLSKSSWVQSLTEIPYEDVISAHSVNFFVPLILCRELLPLMGSSKLNPISATTLPPRSPAEDPIKSTSAPEAYIVNVSSREGIFENIPTAGTKNGKHVHTNTSKAALNMITETEAAHCWRTRRVAMNTVDPGYMSAAPEFAGLGVCPIGWEDGAGRVLWPIAVGEMGRKEKVWGRFLKHFGSVKVEVGRGR